MQGIHASLEPEARLRVTCSTVDSAKGLEANHVRIVFVPRISEDRQGNDIGGFQADPNRFFQSCMRPTDSLILYVPEEELQRHGRLHGEKTGQKRKQKERRAEITNQFWHKLADVVAAGKYLDATMTFGQIEDRG